MQILNLVSAIIITAILYFVLILPISVRFDNFYSSECKKLFYNISIYNLIKINSGYAEYDKGQIIFHVSNNKALILDLKSLTGLQEGVKPLKNYQVVSIKTKLELGGGGNCLAVYSIGYIISYFQNLICWIMMNKKPYLTLKNNVDLYENANFVNVYCESIVFFNLLSVSISLIKTLMEKLCKKKT